MTSTFIIAEAGVNHNGNKSMAIDLIDVAIDAGADAVKFQSFKATSLTTKTAKKADYQINKDHSQESQQNMLKKLEISEDFQFELKEKEVIKIPMNIQNFVIRHINSKLPSITRAFKTQRKAKKLNLSYPSYEEALEDLISEVKELEEAESLDERKSEIGDVLFAIVNVCRYLDADPEIQLNKSTQRFIKRAQYVEKHIEDDSDLDKLWVEAKKTEET